MKESVPDYTPPADRVKGVGQRSKYDASTHESHPLWKPFMEWAAGQGIVFPMKIHKFTAFRAFIAGYKHGA